MKNPLPFLILFLLFISPNLFSQTKVEKLKFTLLDSLTKKPMEFATIGLFNIDDSVAFKYALSDQKGKVQFESLAKKSYIILANYVGYETLQLVVDLTNISDNIVTIGSILMKTSSLKVEDVVVKGRIMPFMIKGDSTIYNASAFNPSQTDFLEDLLKKMPGLEVRNGVVYFKGKVVSNLTVEGKPFFSSDRSIALQNLPAYAIKQISVHNKKTARGTFSGMDVKDEPLELDVTLKDNMKKGIIGNLLGGYGTENRYKGKGFMGRFTPGAQFAFIAEGNNTSTMLAPTTTRSAGGGAGLTMTNDLMGFSKLSSQGIVETISTGGDYSITNKNKEKNNSNTTNLNLSYKGSEAYVEELLKRETYLTDNMQYYNNTQKQTDRIDLIAFSGSKSHVKLQKGFHIELKTNLSYSEQKTNKESDYKTTFKNNEIASNKGNGKDRFNSNLFDGDATLQISKYSMKKEKQGRGITADFMANYKNNDNRFNTNSETEFMSDDKLIFKNINQSKSSKDDFFFFGFKNQSVGTFFSIQKQPCN